VLLGRLEHVGDDADDDDDDVDDELLDFGEMNQSLYGGAAVRQSLVQVTDGGRRCRRRGGGGEK